MKYFIDYDDSTEYFSLWEVDNKRDITKLIFTTDPMHDTRIEDHDYGYIKNEIWEGKWIIMEVFENNWNERFSGKWSKWS